MLGKDIFRSDDNYNCIATNVYTRTSDEDPISPNTWRFIKRKR